MDREPGVAPAADARRKRIGDCALGKEEVEHLRTEAQLEEFRGNGRDPDEQAVLPKHAVGGEHMDVRIERDQIPEGLDEEDQSRSAAGPGRGIGVREQPLRDPAQLPEQAAPSGKNRPQQFRQREDVLAVGNGGEDVLLDPLSVGEHALLMAAWAEISRLARKGEQEIVPAR